MQSTVPFDKEMFMAISLRASKSELARIIRKRNKVNKPKSTQTNAEL